MNEVDIIVIVTPLGRLIDKHLAQVFPGLYQAQALLPAIQRRISELYRRGFCSLSHSDRINFTIRLLFHKIRPTNRNAAIVTIAASMLTAPTCPENRYKESNRELLTPKPANGSRAAAATGSSRRRSGRLP